MSLFSSRREKRFWILATFVCLAIYASLFLNTETQILLQNTSLQAILFVIGMILISATVVFNSINLKEVTLILGIVAVYFMLFLRLGLPERSHLIEYSILAIFVYNAIIERYKNDNIGLVKLAFFAFVISLTIGTIDELLQLYLPHRVFDVIDILFNGLVAIMAIVFQVLIQKFRSKK